MSIVLKAAAKINIFLDILGKLENGYHSLFMVMQSVGLYDTVAVEKTDSGISLSCTGDGIPCDSRNTAYKAAEKFFEKSGIRAGAAISIEKNIPHGAGLAGGSADAAAVIVGLNELFGTEYDVTELCEIGLQVGSDVPFCIRGGTCLAQNTGGVISPLKHLTDCHVVLAKPSRTVSTAEAYEMADSVYIYHPDCQRMLDLCEKGDFEGICSCAGNVFEQVVEVPERVEIKRIMRENNAKLAQMSGSGPTVFGIFENENDASVSAEHLKKICPDVFVTRPVKNGVVIL